MSTVKNQINYYPFNSGYSIGNSESGSGASGSLTFTDVKFESSIEGKPVLKIEVNAFAGIKINSIILPESLEEIGMRAFDGSSIKMDELVLPNSLKKIGWYAFSSNSIKKFKIGVNLEIVEKGAFSDNYELEKIEVSKDNPCLSSPDFALYNKNVTILYCVPYLLKNYVIPSTVQELTHRSINQFYATSIWVPHSVKIIRDVAFLRIKNVRSIHIMGNVDYLDNNIIAGNAEYKINSFFYHGTKVYNSSDAFGNRNSLKVLTCNEYNSSFFAGRKVSKFGSCYAMYRSCKQKRTSFMNVYLLITSFLSN